MRTPPGPPHNLIINGAARFFRIPLNRYLIDNFVRYGDTVGFRFLNFPFYLISHPAGVEHVLHTNSENYVKASINYGFLKKLFGEGLITSDGPNWRRQRRIIQPAFQRAYTGNPGPLITNATIDMLRPWQGRSPAEAFDLVPELSRLTSRIFGLAFLGADLSRHAASIAKASAAANQYFGQFNLNRFFPFLPTWLSLKSRFAVHALRRVANELINRWTCSDSGGDDFLSVLVRACYPASGRQLLRQLQDHLVTFILAGHETSATALTWICYLLARHPKVEKRLRAELADVLDGKTATISDLPLLPFSRMVIEESVRLYPPAWFISRSALEDDIVGGYKIPKGSLLILSPYVTHRHPAFWPEPERFDPARFHPAHAKCRPRFAYFPFGGGPRSCIGTSFAMAELHLILVTITQHYHLEVDPLQQVQEQALVTLRPRHAIKVTAHAIKT